MKNIVHVGCKSAEPVLWRYGNRTACPISIKSFKGYETKVALIYNTLQIIL